MYGLVEKMNSRGLYSFVAIFHLLGTPLCSFSFVSGRINKPANCDRANSWFKNGRTFHYTYTTTTESSFVGTTDSKSGFQFMCHIHVDVPRKCEALLKVEDCHLYERLPGADTVYAMDSGSMQFNNAVSKNPVYFQYDRGEVIPDSIVVANDEPTFVLNIKRGMLSALQLKIMNPSEYGKEHTLVDIFGKCPTRYLNQSDPLIYNTKRDLTMCKMPHVFEIQANPFTFVQTLYGGYRESEITEPVYPFGSTVDCEYTTNKRHRITDVKCLQEQVFRPLAYNGSIYATAMTNITQTLKLSGTKKFKSRAVDRHLHNRKISSILFEYEEDDDQNVASTDIFTHIQSMVDGFYTGTSQFIPGHFHQMVLLMRKSKANSLHHLMKDIWNCHGNNTNNCVLIRQMLEKDYFLDGLMSCGTPHCLSTFSHCIGHGHVTNPILHTFFMYDLALNHETSPRVLNVLLDICKSNNSVSCWMPFSVMLNKLMNSDQEKSAKMKDIAYDILTHTRESLGDVCEAGVWESLTPDQQNSTMSKVILFLKVIGNVGKVIQTQYDVVETEIRKQIIPTVLNCAGNSDLPYKITKSALLALQKMSVTDNIKAVLFDVLRDINRDVSVRTSAFLLLAKEKDSDIIRQLIQIMHEDPMEYMRIYIATYVESALENEQPDLQSFREMWKKGIEDSGKELPKHPSLMIGRSRYLEMSRYFRLPLMMTHYGLQMEMDLVYNPASPTFQTVVIRLNYYNGQKHNLVECGVDVRGLDTLMNKMLGRGRGLYNILSVLPSPENMGGQSDSRKKFGVFHPHIVEELNKMLKVINYPQGDIPDGLLHWKVLDHEVMYTELQDLLAAFTHKNMKLSSMKLLESFIFHFNKGHHAVKTRSSKQMDLLKVMPTLSGAPLNLTVLVTSSVSGEMDAKFDVSLLWGIGPVEARASGAIKGAVEFLGEMNIKMRDFSRCGIQMVTQGEMGNTLVSRVTLTKEKQTESVKKHFMVTLESSNVHGSFRLAKFKSYMYLLHSGNGGREQIVPDAVYQTKYHRCVLQPLSFSELTENQLCINVTFPNVSASTTHPYFPLSGPFDSEIYIKQGDQRHDVMVDIVCHTKHWHTHYENWKIDKTIVALRPRGFDKVQMTVQYQIRNTSQGDVTVLSADLAAKDEFYKPGQGPSQERRQTVELSMQHRPLVWKFSYSAPYSNSLFTAMYSLSHSYRFNHSNNHSHFLDFHHQRQQMTISRMLLQMSKDRVKEFSGPKSGYKTRYHSVVKLAASNTSLDLDFEYRKENFGSNYFVFFNSTFFCTKDQPLLYLLHLDPRLAAKNGDTSNIHLDLDAIMGTSPGHDDNWIARDTITLSYPGQLINVHNEMVSNLTFAHRDTNITFLNGEGVQELLIMKAYVRNETNDKEDHYCYFMTANNSNKYEATMEGHLLGRNGSYDFSTSIDFKKLKFKTDVNKRSLTGDKGKKDDSDCWSRLAERDSWIFQVNASVHRNITRSKRGSRPTGYGMSYTLDVLYPSCEKYSHMHSHGSFGKIRYDPYKRWLIFDVTFSDADHVRGIGHIIKNPVTLYLRYNGDVTAQRQMASHVADVISRFDFNGGNNNSWIIEQKIHSVFPIYDFPKYLNFHAIQETPFSLLNYMFNSTLTLHNDDKASQQTECTWTWINLWQNNSLTRDKNTSQWTFTSTSKLKNDLQLMKGSWDVITSMDVGRRTLPKFSMHSEEDHGNSTLLFDVQLVSPSVLNFTLSRQKKGSPAIRLITWSIATAESTSLFHVVDWNPAVTQPVIGIMTGLKVKLGQKFIKAGEETLKNLHRDYPDYVIIFLDKSPKMILKQYVMPILVRVPPAKYIARRFLLHGKSSSLPANVPGTKVKQVIHGNVLWYVCTKLQSAVLKGIGEVLINPPSLFPPFMKNVVEPALKKAIIDSQISYTTPLPFKLKNFMSFPQRTIGEKYLENVLRRLIFDKKTKRPPFTAWIYRRQFIQTFDNKAFKIPETSVECTHVLTADGKEGKFALVMSQQELTLLTLTRPVTIDTQGRVFIEDCNNPRIPVLGSNITGEGVIVTRQNNGWIKVTTSYGIDVACSPVRELCKVSVSTHLLNRTFGLLGVTDYEEGTDFRIRNGRIVLDASEFVSDYRILSQSCQSIKPTYTVDEGCSDVCKEVFELKYVSTRNCASKDIFVKACLMSDCKSTQDDRCEEMKTFMSTCSSMSSRYMLSRVYQRAGCSGDWREPTQPLPVTTIPADIILVISSFSNGNDSLVALLDIMAELSSMTDDIRVGILHYGQSTKPQNKQTSSLFLDIRNVSAKTVGQIWREDPAILSEVEAIKAAMNYPLRLHSTKQVILLTPQQESTSSIDVDHLIDLYKEKNVIFNVISKYSEFSGGSKFGINWDGEVMYRQEFKYGSESLPNVEMMRLVEESMGTVFDINKITPRKTNILNKVAEHLKFQHEMQDTC